MDNKNIEDTLLFYVNGRKVEAKEVDPRWSLAVFLRYKLHLKGTKIGCNTGGCGSCVVMVSERDAETGVICHRSLNSCLTPVCLLHGKSVTTVEGVGQVTHMHAIQERLSACHGSQCGFCTPGFVMSMYTLLRNNASPSKEDIDQALQGNLCRCTGYRPILEAFYSFVDDNRKKQSSGQINSSGCCMGQVNQGVCCGMGQEDKRNGHCIGQENEKSSSCCMAQRDITNCCKNKTCESEELTSLTDLSKYGTYDPKQEPIFPPELLLNDYSGLSIKHKDVSWIQPRTLEQLLELKAEFPHAKLVHGNTEIGVETKLQVVNYSVLINPQSVAELGKHYLSDDGLYLGSNINLNKCSSILVDAVKDLPDYKTKVFKEVIRMLHWFGGRHIRNAASIAGNIATASPISDLNQIWLASGAVVTLASAYSQHSIKIDQNFFINYRKTIIKPEEVIIGILIPFSTPNQHFVSYKQSKRRQDDIAIVNAAMNVHFKEGTRIVDQIALAFGGMAERTVLAVKTCDLLNGREWNDYLLNFGLEVLLEDLLLLPGVPGGMEKFRQTLCLSFFFKFYHHVLCSLNDVGADKKSNDPVGRPIMHMSGQKHVTGQAPYCDDIRKDDALHLALVLSERASAKLLSIDASNALNMDGIVAFVDYRDIPGKNLHGIVIQDTPVFAENEVTYYGQPIGAIVAVSAGLARQAVAKVKVQYEDMIPVITIEDALSANSFHQPPTVLTNKRKDGNSVPDFDWSKFEHVISGSARVGGQEHFYMEPNSCIVTPTEFGEYEVIASTQSASHEQRALSGVLGIPCHKIVVKVKRIGGGFGGKESANTIYLTATAVAAYKLGKPVRFTVERYDDMVTSGTRHPFLGHYKAAFDNQGHIQAYKLDLLVNGGHTLDLSSAVLGNSVILIHGVGKRCILNRIPDRAMLSADNTYDFGDVFVKGQICRTNLMSCTAFRGFGAPQAMLISECMLDQVASTLGMESKKVRELNMYDEGSVTFSGMTLKHCNLQRCWGECEQLSEYEKRKQIVDDFNKNNQFKKHGISITPAKYGIAYGHRSLNQAGALVHAYLDGSVLVSIAGMEMGQGLYTKVTQIAAKVLNISVDLVTILETSSDKVPNTAPTAASVGSDLNGEAVKNACETILRRLAPYKSKYPDAQWVELLNMAYQDMVSLSATGIAKIEITHPDFVTGKGNPNIFNYWVYGAACTEVEIDCLTGDHRMLRTDIVMDLGESLNPAVDIGQIEGAFIQGYGLFTMEELKCSPSGVIYSRGPATYKIPTADDVPREFNVKLLKGSSNEKAIFSSKAVGEPPLLLGVSAFFAIKDAIRAARKDIGLRGHFVLNSPATPEAVRLAVEDDLSKKVPEFPDNFKGHWTVPL